MLRYEPRIEVTTWHYCLQWTPHTRSLKHCSFGLNTWNELEVDGFCLCASAQHSGRQLGMLMSQCATCLVKAMI